jgi:hypothetical protein
LYPKQSALQIVLPVADPPVNSVGMLSGLQLDKLRVSDGAFIG